MKAAKKRPRNAISRKPTPKTRTKAAQQKPAPRSKRKAAPPAPEYQRRLVIRFTDPTDADWLAAQCERMRLGSPKGAGAATYVRMLIGAARECSEQGAGNALDVLRGMVGMRTTGYGHTAHGIDYEDDPPPAQEEGEPVDVDDLVGRLAEQVEPQQREAPQHQEQEPGRVRVMGARVQRRPLDWGGR